MFKKRYVIVDIVGFHLKSRRGCVYTWTKKQSQAYVFDCKWVAETVARVVGGNVKQI